MGLLGTNCEFCGIYFSWATPRDVAKLRLAGAGGKFCSAACRAAYAGIERENAAQANYIRSLKDQQEKEQAEQIARANLVSQLKQIWSSDPLICSGYYEINSWNRSCPNCQSKFEKFDSLDYCSICRSKTTQIVYDIDELKYLSENKYCEAEPYVSCTKCNSLTSLTLECDHCETVLLKVPLQNAGGFDLIPFLEKSDLWMTEALALDIETTRSWLGAVIPVKDIAYFRKKYGVPANLPILGAANLTTKLVIAGYTLFFIGADGSRKAEPLKSLAELSTRRPKRGWFKTRINVGESCFQLSNGELDQFLAFIDSLAIRLNKRVVSTFRPSRTESSRTALKQQLETEMVVTESSYVAPEKRDILNKTLNKCTEHIIKAAPDLLKHYNNATRVEAERLVNCGAVSDINVLSDEMTAEINLDDDGVQITVSIRWLLGSYGWYGESTSDDTDKEETALCASLVALKLCQ